MGERDLAGDQRVIVGQNWLERRMVDRAQSRYGVPVAEVIVEPD